MTLLAKTLHGSRLYRLDNPSSDYDYKAIHLPPMEECLLLRASRNVNEKTQNSDGIKEEYESFALQEFVALAARGEDVAICMLHARGGDILLDSPTFQYLRERRHRFYTKTMKGSLGYARSQSAKYALRADRMENVLTVIKAIEEMRDKGIARLDQAWDDLPNLLHTRRFENENDRAIDKRIYEVAGKGLKPTVAPDYALGILYALRDSYGERVKSARQMGGSDMKAISHSFRVGYQLLHIYQDGGFSFPLPESDFIRAVKEGKLNYVDDKLDDKLNELITRVEQLSEQSKYPENVERSWLDEIVLKTYDTC